MNWIKLIRSNNKIDKVYSEFLDFIPFMNTMLPNYKERSEKKTYIKAIKDFAKNKNVSSVDLYRKIKQEMPEFVSGIKEKDLANIEKDSKDE